MDIAGSQHPDAVQMAERMIENANEGRREWLQKQLDSAVEFDLITDTELFVGSAIAFDFNMERIFVAQEMVIRGLHFHEFGVILPPHCTIDVNFIPWHKAPDFIQKLSAKTPMNPTVKGRDVAWWTSHAVQDFPEDSKLWVICYNDGVLFSGTTGEFAIAWRKLRESRRGNATSEADAIKGETRSIVVPRDLAGKPMIPPQ